MIMSVKFSPNKCPPRYPNQQRAVAMLTEFDTQASYPREFYVRTVDALSFSSFGVFESLLDDTSRRFNTCMRGRRSLLEYAVH
jgi:hypothetical protein